MADQRGRMESNPTFKKEIIFLKELICVVYFVCVKVFDLNNLSNLIRNWWLCFIVGQKIREVRTAKNSSIKTYTNLTEFYLDTVLGKRYFREISNWLFVFTKFLWPVRLSKIFWPYSDVVLFKRSYLEKELINNLEQVAPLVYQVHHF